MTTKKAMTSFFSGDDLLQVLLSLPDEQLAWQEESSLRSVLADVAVADISRMEATGSSYLTRDRQILRLKVSGSFIFFDLPNDVEFETLELLDGPLSGPRFLIRLAWEGRQVETNAQELMRKMLSRGLSDKEYRERLESLAGDYEAPPPPPPVPPEFRTRHLGKITPSRHGMALGYDDEIENKISIGKFSDISVMTKSLLAEDASEIDRVLDQYLDGFEEFQKAATPHLIQDMRDFIDAVYRDPDRPPPADLPLDATYEEMLSLANPADIWGYVRPNMLVLTRKGKPPKPPEPQRIAEGPIYVVLGGDCDWEEEHGVELVWKDGEGLVRVQENGGPL